MKYLRLFKTDAEYNTFKTSSEYIEPHVVAIGESIDKLKPTYQVERPKEITFKVNKTVWYAMEGMTWEEFAISDYNNHNSNDMVDYVEPTFAADGYVRYFVAEVALLDLKYNGNNVNRYDKIIANGEYTAQAPICCFIPGTQVTMADYSTKIIEDVTVGDNVLSYDLNTEEFYGTMVKRVITKNVTNIARVTFENGETLTMNEYHPILTQNGWHSLTRYNSYDTLEIGDICKTTGGWSSITAIDRTVNPSGITMYNLDVADKTETEIDNELNDNFIANNIVVHNPFC